MEQRPNSTRDERYASFRQTKNGGGTFIIQAFKCCTSRTMRQLFFRDTGHPLEIIMTGVAKMCRPKAEEHSHRATVTAFILQEICPVFRAHLQQKE